MARGESKLLVTEICQVCGGSGEAIGRDSKHISNIEIGPCRCPTLDCGCERLDHERPAGTSSSRKREQVTGEKGHIGVRPLPLVGKVRGKALACSACFASHHAIDAVLERSELTSMFNACIEVLVFLFLLVTSQNLFGVLSPVCRGRRCRLYGRRKLLWCLVWRRDIAA
jgi:hypothetical protein